MQLHVQYTGIKTLYGRTCRPRIVVTRSSEGNQICVFRGRLEVQISDMYLIKIHIWKWPRSDAKKSDLVGFCLYTYATNSDLSDVRKKKQILFSSVNTAIDALSCS